MSEKVICKFNYGLYTHEIIKVENIKKYFKQFHDERGYICRWKHNHEIINDECYKYKNIKLVGDVLYCYDDTCFLKYKLKNKEGTTQIFHISNIGFLNQEGVFLIEINQYEWEVLYNIICKKKDEEIKKLREELEMKDDELKHAEGYFELMKIS